MDSTVEIDPGTAKKFGKQGMSEPVQMIAEQLYSQIAAGEHRHRLPSERQLADEFGVPRNSIRSALELLEQRDVISRRAGSGNFVKNPAVNSSTSRAIAALNLLVAEETGPQKLQAVRDIFEPELVRLVVAHASPKSIGELGIVIKEMAAIDTDAEAFVDCEEKFCVQLANSTENPLLVAIYELITDVRRLSNWKAQRRKKLSPEKIRDCQLRYRKMFEAIENRDAGEAVKILRSKLSDENSRAIADD